VREIFEIFRDHLVGQGYYIKGELEPVMTVQGPVSVTPPKSVLIVFAEDGIVIPEYRELLRYFEPDMLVRFDILMREILIDQKEAPAPPSYGPRYGEPEIRASNMGDGV